MEKKAHEVAIYNALKRAYDSMHSKKSKKHKKASIVKEALQIPPAAIGLADDVAFAAMNIAKRIESGAIKDEARRDTGYYEKPEHKEEPHLKIPGIIRI